MAVVNKVIKNAVKKNGKKIAKETSENIFKNSEKYADSKGFSEKIKKILNNNSSEKKDTGKYVFDAVNSSKLKPNRDTKQGRQLRIPGTNTKKIKEELGDKKLKLDTSKRIDESTSNFVSRNVSSNKELKKRTVNNNSIQSSMFEQNMPPKPNSQQEGKMLIDKQLRDQKNIRNKKIQQEAIEKQRKQMAKERVQSKDFIGPTEADKFNSARNTEKFGPKEKKYGIDDFKKASKELKSEIKGDKYASHIYNKNINNIKDMSKIIEKGDKDKIYEAAKKTYNMSDDKALDFSNRNRNQQFKQSENWLKERIKNPTTMDKLGANKVPQKVAAVGTTAWMVSNMSAAKGQQSNAQLYGQQTPYQ